MKKIKLLFNKGSGKFGKIMLLSVFLAIVMFCNAQNHKIVKAEYFLDTDPGFGLATNINISSDSVINVNTLIPLTKVQQGIHIIYFRVKDNKGKWSTSQIIPFYTIKKNLSNQISKIEYFFDTDPGFGKGTKISFTQSSNVTTNFNIPLTNTTEGFHELYFRTFDKGNEWSLCQIIPFYCVRNMLNNQISKIEYFLDSDPGFGKGIPISYTQSSNVTTLFNIPLTNTSEGFHEIYFRTLDKESKWSLCQIIPFYCVRKILNNQIAKMEYFIDIDPEFGKGTQVSYTQSSDVTTLFNIPLTNTSGGFHEIYFRSMDKLQKWGLCQIIPFFTIPALVNNNVTEIEYFWDIDPGFGLATQVKVTTPAANVNYPFAVYYDTLATGKHMLYVRTKDLRDKWSMVYYQIVYISNKSNINGIVTYDNSISSPLKNVRIYIKSDSGFADSTVTDVNGTYAFSNLLNGNYTLTATSNNPTGSINPVDALVVNRVYVKLYTFPDDVRKGAADVNIDGKVNPVDALIINRYYVKLINTFKAGKWYFEPSNFKLFSQDTTYNVKGICVGDVNASFKP